MFNFVHKHKKIIQLVLALMFIPFMFSGVSNLTTLDFNGDVVAKIGKQSITKTVFEQSFGQYKDKVRAQMGDKFSEADFDTPEQRAAFLNEMVDEYTVSEAVQSEHLTVSDAQLVNALLKDPIVSRDAQGNIDRAKYEALLKQNHLTEAQYENGVRNRLSTGLIEQVSGSGFNLQPLQQAAIGDVLTQVRLVEVRPLDLSPYMTKITIGSDKVDAYYKSHAAQFTKTESFDVDYVVIPVLPANYVPNDADIKMAFGGTPTAEEINKVKKDPALIKEVLAKTALAKMEAVAKDIDAVSAKAPQDLSAVASRFGGQVESSKNVTRTGDDALPEPLKSTDARLALITGTQVVGKAISSPVKLNDTSLIVGRVTKQTPAGLLPLADVQAEIEKTLKRESVVAQAREDAQKQVASMAVNASIGAPVAVGPLLNSPLSRSTVAQVLALGVKDVPKLLVSDDTSSVSIVRVIGEDPNKPSVDKFTGLKPALQQWGGISGALQQRAYLNILRERLGVKLYPEHLGGTEKGKA